MGYDTLKIVSMNVNRLGGNNRQSFLRELLDGQQPELCLLPGDNSELKKAVIFGYESYQSQGTSETVLLYKAENIKLKRSAVTCDMFPPLPGINYDSIVCPEAEVDLGSHQQPKRFSILTWDFHLTQVKIRRETQAESIVRLSQMIAETRQIPILVGGDFNIDACSIEKIVSHLNKEKTNGFMEMATNSGLFPSEKYLPSMTKGSLRPQRHLFAMRVFACKKNSSIVAEYQSYQQTDFFLASKELELRETSRLDCGGTTGQCTQLQKVHDNRTETNHTQCYQPTKTEMVIPPRPPKHHGG